VKDTFDPVLAWLAQGPSNFPGGGEDLESLLSAFYLLFGAGFVIGLLGHVFDSKTLRGAGIALVFIGTGVFFVAVGRFD